MRNPLTSLGSYRAPKSTSHWLTKGAILYSTCDEDSHSELRALDLGPDDEAVSITGSGCRSLALLAAAPRRVVSVDANPLQNHLLELKARGIQHLSRAEFLRFIGVSEARRGERADVYTRIRPELSDDARDFWDLNRRVIERGVIFSGAHETFYRRHIGPLIRILRRRRLRQLFAFEDLQAQSRFYREKWDHAGWRAAVRLLARPTIVKMLLGDPSYYAQVTRDQGFADYLLERLRGVFDQHLARDNDVFTMYVFGRYLSDSAVPLYLAPEAYDEVRANIDRLEIVTEPIGEYLASLPDASVDKLSLSDISGWAPADDFNAILADAARVSRPGGRLCYRNFLADRPLPEALHSSMTPLPDLGDELTRTDRAFAFTFVVAEAVPASTLSH